MMVAWCTMGMVSVGRDDGDGGVWRRGGVGSEGEGGHDGDEMVAAMVSAGDVDEVAKMVDMVLWVASAVMVVMMTVVAGCGCRRGWRRVAASGYGDR
ncbi:hypothetical protein Tco_0575871, partial [Tanacetum coccineum]